MEQIKPLGNRVLVKRAEAQKSKGGILLPDTAKEKPRRGQVVAVGPGRIDEEGKLQPCQVAVGDEVVYSPYSGTEVGSEEHLLISEDDILGVLV
ncbi:MAG: co-chaperone GroES [Verrucomicrobia bacterium]|nr:co-chaperone GroES [Verrucomicrobiota bacterium]